MKAWLIVNGFISSSKFSDLYGYLLASAQRHGIKLEIKSSDSLVCKTDEEINNIVNKVKKTKFIFE